MRKELHLGIKIKIIGNINACLVTNSKIWGEMFGTKEMHFLFSDEGTTQLYLDVEAALARSQSKLNIIPKEAGKK